MRLQGRCEARRARRRRGVAIALLACACFAPGLARGQVDFPPCQPGSFSPDGFEPGCALCSPGNHAPAAQSVACLPCPAGTYADFAGASDCQPCPAGTYASSTGATECQSAPEGTWAPLGSSYVQPCECADEPLCTIDRCDARTGACTAHDPAPACAPYSVQVSGTVAEVSFSGGAPEVFAVGMPLVATWLVDPSELDREPTDFGGYYPNAIRNLRVRVGGGSDAVEAIDDFDGVYFASVPPTTTDYLDIFAQLTAPGWDDANFVLTLDEGDDPVITSDAIPPVFPSAASFAFRDLYFVLRNGEARAQARSSDFVITTPEPHAILAAPLAFAALAALRRRRSPTRPMRTATTG